MKKIICLILINLTILNSMSFLMPQGSYAQVKSSNPAVAAPGELVRVKIQVNGSSVDTRNPLDVMLVMDRTGSMLDAFGGVPKINAAKSALKLFVGKTDAALDRLGFVSYSSPDNLDAMGKNCFAFTNCATLHSQLTQMTSGNRTSVNSQIDSLVAEGGTSIGAGLAITVNHMLNFSRPLSQAHRYIVMATDGMNTVPPSPYNGGAGNPNFIQIAANNGIQIITVGIGDDAKDWYNITDGTPGNCRDCPWVAPNPALGINCSTGQCVSGELLMKDFACQTDPQCNKNPATRLDTNPATNDLGTPRFYFYSNSQAELESDYNTIFETISEGTSYQILDEINTEIFSGIEGNIDVTNCSGSPAGDVVHKANSRDTVYVIVKNVDAGENVCIEFSARIHALSDIVTCDEIQQTFDSCLASRAPNLSFPIDAINPRLIGSWNEDQPTNCDSDGDTDLSQSEITNCFNQISPGADQIERGLITIDYTLPPPADPWFQTDKGDVRFSIYSNEVPEGQTGSSDLLYPGILFSSKANATGIDSTAEISPKGWLVENEYLYNPGSKNRNGTLSYSFYKSKARQEGVEVKPLNSGVLNQAQITGSGVYEVQGNLTISSYNQIAGRRVVILASGDVVISADEIDIPIASGLLIIAAKGNIIIRDNVTDIDGYYSSEKNIEVETANSCPTADSRLIVGGVLVANSLKPFADNDTGRLINERGLCGVNNFRNPSLIVESRLDFLTQLTDFYKTTYTKWEEEQP